MSCFEEMVNCSSIGHGGCYHRCCCFDFSACLADTFFQVEVFGISHSAVHWLGWIGALYIAFATPIYPIIKRKYSHFVGQR